MKKALLIILLTGLVGCTENSRAKSWGGTEDIQLKSNEVLINMTWKESNLWVQTLDTTIGIQYFREKSSWDWLEGQIIVNPPKKKVKISNELYSVKDGVYFDKRLNNQLIK